MTEFDVLCQFTFIVAFYAIKFCSCSDDKIFITQAWLYRVYKKCPKWKIASTSDIPQNLGHFFNHG